MKHIDTIIGFVFLGLAILTLVLGDTTIASTAIGFYGNLILANIFFIKHDIIKRIDNAK